MDPCGAPVAARSPGRAGRCGAMHELAVRLAVPLMTEKHHEVMRAANRRFADAVEGSHVEDAVDADDALHDVPVAVLGNRALAATIERQLPLIGRLKRL